MSHTRIGASLAWFFLLAGFVVSLPAAGQDILISGVTITDDDTAAQIESAISAVEGQQGLDEETRDAVIRLLRDAESLLQSRRSADIMAEQFAAALDTVPAETAVLRAELDGNPPEPVTTESLGIDAGTSLAELQQQLARATAELAGIDTQLAEYRAQVEAQVGRPAVARASLDQLERSRKELAAIAESPAAAGETQMLTNARRLESQLRRAAQSAEINKLEQELLSHSVRLNLLRAKRDVAARSQVALQQQTGLLRAAMNETQQATELHAQQAAIAAEMDAADKHAVIRSLAKDNASLAVRFPRGAADIQSASARLGRIKEETRSIERRLARSRQHIEIGGLSRVTGRLLIEERRSLPQLSRYQSNDAEIAQVGLALMIIQEQRRELTPLDDRAQALVADVDVATVGEEGLASINEDIRLLLRNRRDLLLQAENSYRSYLQVLGDLDNAQRQLQDSAEEYEEFLNQNLLWIPSAPIAFTESWGDLKESVAWAVSPAAWSKSLDVLGQSLRHHVLAAVVFVLLLGLLLLARSPSAAMHRSMSQKVGRLSADNIGLTLGSLAIAGVRVLPAPLFLAGMFWFFDTAPEATAFSDTIARALIMTAPFLFYTLLLRILSAPDGVFREHFGWRPENLTLARRQLGRLAAGGTPLIFIMVFMFVSENVAEHTNLGRFVFVPLMVFLAFIIHPFVQPSTGVAASYYKNRPGTWISKFRWTWYFVATGIPLMLALISILGNVYTSTKLAELFLDTVWLVVGLVIVNMIVLRWLALSRRKLELKILLQKREAQKAEREANAQPGGEGEIPVAAAEPLDLDAVDQQSKKFLRLGLVFIAAIAGWQIWSHVLPAFTLLESVSLWSQTELVDGVETITPVTLADLLLAILVILVSAIASRNLPGFMEIALPQRLNVEIGSRYAINALVRYFIIMVGTISVLNIIGWNWSQIQWLVAALSVGLGFGLQEIVANFVSGLVILFERPVRVGDTVTVGQLTGTVTRIRIRATTITDWDRKEIIVPNKSFITEQVVNWTLTDPITRIVIPVGVSYGSDVEAVHKIMSDTLPKVPLVLEEPAPRVYFVGFGDSSLDFNLHVYLRQLTDRMPLVHEVHNAIFVALRENGIEIPFPQRDLHIRSTAD